MVGWHKSKQLPVPEWRRMELLTGNSSNCTGAVVAVGSSPRWHCSNHEANVCAFTPSRCANAFGVSPLRSYATSNSALRAW